MIGSRNCPITGVRLEATVRLHFLIIILQINQCKIQQFKHQSLFKAGAFSKMEESVTLDSVSTEDIFPNVNSQLFLQFTINEKLHLKAISFSNSTLFFRKL